MSRTTAAPLRTRVAGVVLAAGDSRRMGRPKAALSYRGTSFVARALAALGDGGAEPLLVVVGRHGDAVRAALPSDREVVVLANPDPDRGQLASLQVALRHLAADAEIAAVLVTLVDHPAVRPATVAALVAALAPPAPADAAAIAVPIHGGRRGHPVGFCRALWAELLATPDDLGARAVTRRDAKRVREVAVDDPGIHLDVDTPGDLERLLAAPLS